MTRSSRSFALATQASVDEKNSAYEEVEFDFIDPDAELPKGRKTPLPRTVTARYPGEGEMIVMAASVGMTDAEMANPVGVLFSFLKKIFDEADYNFIHEQIKQSRLDLREDVMEIVADLMEVWSGVPTQQ